MIGRSCAAFAASALFFFTGCAPLFPQEFLDLFGLDGGFVTAQNLDTSSPSIATGPNVGRLTGSLQGAQTYRVFELGGAAPGDALTIRAERSNADAFVIALMDEEFNLLRRVTVDAGESLQHVLRSGAPKLFAGVAPAYADGGGAFDLRVSLSSGNRVPAPAAQRVFLNFGGASNVEVNTRGPIHFPAFQGQMLGQQYAGATDPIMAEIVARVRDDYRDYNVEIYGSHESDPPPAPYSTIHFGSDDRGLLGLADNVDEYNEAQSQAAIIYVGAFKLFEYLNLPEEDMAIMVANVASHELGHLLGLYHTKDPADVMDTTGSVYDLASDQRFVRAPLEQGVFPVGFGDSPVLLDQTVGHRPAAASRLKPLHDVDKRRQREALRRVIERELTDACGTCLQLEVAQPR